MLANISNLNLDSNFFHQFLNSIVPEYGKIGKTMENKTGLVKYLNKLKFEPHFQEVFYPKIMNCWVSENKIWILPFVFAVTGNSLLLVIHNKFTVIKQWRIEFVGMFCTHHEYQHIHSKKDDGGQQILWTGGGESHLFVKVFVAKNSCILEKIDTSNNGLAWFKENQATQYLRALPSSNAEKAIN